MSLLNPFVKHYAGSVFDLNEAFENSKIDLMINYLDNEDKSTNFYNRKYIVASKNRPLGEKEEYITVDQEEKLDIDKYYSEIRNRISFKIAWIWKKWLYLHGDIRKVIKGKK